MNIDMEKFPSLNDNQVALLRADFNTGIVLDEHFLYAAKPEQVVYTVFDSADEALAYAKKIILERPDIECGIYRKNEDIVFNLTKKNISSY